MNKTKSIHGFFVGVALCFCFGLARADEWVSEGGVLGFVLIGFDVGFYETADGKEECPDGFTLANRDQWALQFPTKDLQEQHLNRCGGSSQNRGPNCENVWFSPDVMKDPVPHREAQGKFAYGLDLDGVPDGEETSSICAHKNFTSPDGAKGVDNQLFRFGGCEKATRTLSAEQVSKAVFDFQPGRHLMEVTGVDDEKNDDSVEVSFYVGRDVLLADSYGKASQIPGQSQRIEPGGLIGRVRGRIVDGILETEPARYDAHSFGWFFLGLPSFHGMRIRLTLTPSGAEGWRAGYVDVDRLWADFAYAGAGYGAMFGASGPSAYLALHELADGYKDPETGRCTALSAAQRVKFVRAHLIHPAGGIGSTVIGQ